MKIEVSNIESPLKLDKFLKKHTSIPFFLVHKLIRKRLIKVDQKRVSSSVFVENGQIIDIFFDIKSFKPEKQIDTNSTLYKQILSRLRNSIIFEDQNIIVFNKDAGLNVQAGTRIGCSIDDVLVEFSSNGIRPRLVHRLDRDTSGILIVAKNLDTSKKISDLFQNHKISKTYIAITSGSPKSRTGKLNIEIADNKGSKTAETNYKILERLKENLYLVEFNPKTGRKHQIRITAKELGCPILGDKKYGPHTKQKNLFLHCLEMKLSIDNKKYSFKAELPKHFLEVIRTN